MSKQQFRSASQTVNTLMLYLTRLVLDHTIDHLLNLWLITKDDIPTFVGPNTVFGISCALAGSPFFGQAISHLQVWNRLPRVIIFNWSNLLVFDLANQRLPESSLEDALNKPWRPVPCGRLTSNHLRLAMLFCIPLVLALNHFVLHVGTESCLILILTWLYNDLRGGDEDWILRNVIIAAAFGLYNTGSAKTAAGVGTSIVSDDAVQLTMLGTRWIAVISGVIATTMHVQDLKDQEGDRARGRRSAPLVLGDAQARWTISIFVVFWSIFCAWFWDSKDLVVVPLALGAFVAWRCVTTSGKEEDRTTWQIWALWTAALYILPLF